MEKSNVVNFKRKITNTVEQPRPQVNLVSVDVATLLYNLIQTQRELIERIDEMADMIEHMEYQVDKLSATTRSRPRTESQDS